MSSKVVMSNFLKRSPHNSEYSNLGKFVSSHDHKPKRYQGGCGIVNKSQDLMELDSDRLSGWSDWDETTDPIKGGVVASGVSLGDLLDLE